ncbi:MAG: GNAT family N-acetyltransferase [Chloroflexales bacterium]|nr:GNAT family N-acetyltransferase [Chloroflexales bacterium]
MSQVNSRPYAGSADLQHIMNLLLKCRATESIDHWPPVHALQRHLRVCSSTQATNTQIWEDSDHHQIAFATFWEGADLVFCIHPYMLSQYLEDQIITWAMAHAREIGHTYGECTTLCVPVCADDHTCIRVLERRGFAPAEWSTLRMSCSLAAPIPDPQAPSGFTLSDVASEQRLEDYVALHRDIFGASQFSITEQLDRMHDPAYLANLDVILLDPAGVGAAFCQCSISPEPSPWSRCQEGWIDLLGTRPTLRRQGLGRAVLLAGLQRLRAYGCDVALLGAGNWNAAAQHLASAIGFSVIHEILWYTWEEEKNRYSARYN